MPLAPQGIVHLNQAKTFGADGGRIGEVYKPSCVYSGPEPHDIGSMSSCEPCHHRYGRLLMFDA